MKIKKFLNFIFIFFILTLFLSPKILAEENINNLKICSKNKISDNRFLQYVNSGLLIEDCNKENLPTYLYAKCNKNDSSPKAVIMDIVEDGEGVDGIFDAIFDHCINPEIIIIDPQTHDSYFAGLFSSAVFFYVKGTRYINVGDINNLNEYRKKLILAFLNFLNNSPVISYPELHPQNGDPWKGKFGEPPKAMGIIGNNFAFFTNLTNKIVNFEKDNLMALDGFNLFSNQKSSVSQLTSTSLSLDANEVIFITNITIPSPIPITPSPTLNPTQSTITPTIYNPSLTPSTLTLTPTPTSIIIFPEASTPTYYIPPQPESFPVEEIIKLFQKGKERFNLEIYLFISIFYIIIFHLIFNIGSEFNLLIMTFIFFLGGMIGYNFSNIQLGFLFSFFISLMFISGPRKDL